MLRSRAALFFGVMFGSFVIAAAAPARPRVADQPDRKLAERVVFEVTVRYSDKQVADIVQPGFLVDKGGVGVTSYNALHNAKSVTAKFVGDSEPMPVQLLIAEPVLDVALVKLAGIKEGSGRDSDRLEFSTGPLREGEAVWTLQASASLDEAKAVAGSALLSARGGAGPDGLPFAAPGWIYTESRIDRRASGYPLVDERGRLVGINVWAWPSGKSRPMGLTSRVVSDLLDAYRDEVKKAKDRDLPAPVMDIQQASAKYHERRLNGSVFPRMVWLPSSRSAEEARAAASKLNEDITCSSCKGTGYSEVRTQQNKTGPGGRGVTEYGTKKNPCAGCERSKIRLQEQLGLNCARAAGKMARVSPGSAEYDEVLKSFAESSQSISRLAGAAFTQRLNNEARMSMNLRRLRRGEAVMLVGMISRDPALAAWDTDVATITLSGGQNVRVLGVAPDDAGRLRANQSALICGVITGMVTVRAGEDWVVLDRVMAVPFAP